MNDDLLYQQLLDDPGFVAWVLNRSAPENTFWQSWEEENPDRREILSQARLTVLALYGKKIDVSDEQVSAKAQLLLEKAKTRERNNGLNPWWRLTRPENVKWLAAASILFFMGLGWIAYNAFDRRVAGTIPGKETADTTPAKSLLKEVTNNDSALKHVLLADGSSVVLYKNSKLTYPEAFTAEKRIVSLSGDAFFEVAKDSLRPFFVHVNGLVTKVVGTSFSIKSGGANDNVTVSVKTGKVLVFAENKSETGSRDISGGSTLMLTPNEQVVFEKNSSRLVKTSSAKTGLLDISIEKQPFEYEHTPIAEVFSSLENAYGINIQFDRKTMADCSLSAVLGDEPLETKLEWICAILEASYKIDGQQITITGKPCN